MKLKLCFIGVLMMLTSFLRGQVVVFNESVQTPAANPTPVASHTFQNSGIVTYTESNSEVRSTNYGTPYPGFTNLGHVAIISSTSWFMMSGINTSGVTGLTMTLGHFKGNTSSSNELIIEVSSDGLAWAQLSYTRPSGAGTGSTWVLLAPTGTIPSTPNLRIRFRNTITTTFRIDDIKLRGTPSNSWANLQSPASGTIITGGNHVVNARVEAPGYTYIDGPQADMVAEIGYSSNNSNPSGGDWTWVPALYSLQVGARDEYLFDLGGEIFFPGTYYYASRFSIDGGPYMYGGYSGSGGGIWNGTTNVNGVLTVIDSQVVLADSQAPFTGTASALQTYEVYAQVHQPGLTEGAGQGTGVQAWIGYSQTNTNPNSASWSWIPATYDPSVTGPNDQYMADIGPYLNANTTFYYASRFQLGTGTYSYGAFHMDGVSPGNFWDGTTYISGTVTVSGASDPNNYYRSRTSGLWEDMVSWESSADNVSWQNATRSPTVSAPAITIRNGHLIDSSVNQVADDILIEAGAALEISSGAFTLNNGAAAIDLQVNGTFTNSGATFTNNGSITVAGTYNHDTNSMILPIATWAPGSTCSITGLDNLTQTPLINGGQVYHNFTFNNHSSQHLVSILGPVFQVNGTLTLGPNPASYLLLATTAGTFTRTVNKLDILEGQLTVSGSQSIVTFNVLTDALVSGGRLGLSGGLNGRATMNVANNFTLTGMGIVSMIDHSSGQSPLLTVGNDFIISGLEPTMEIESTSSVGAQATVTVLGDFICSSMSDAYPLIDFGTGTILNNVINVAGDFNKTGDGIFYTSSDNPAKGFVFNGTAVQNFTDTGAYVSHKVNYTINSGATVAMNSDLTLGDGSFIPYSTFTVNTGGTLDFGIHSIIASDATSKFSALGTTTPAATLRTSNPDGMGGTIAAGSLQNFAAASLLLQNGVNYTFDGDTTTPYPIPVAGFTSAGTININANVQSNMDSQLILQTAFNVNDGAIYTMNPTSIINDHRLNGGSILTVAPNGVFDNGGENRVIKGAAVSAAVINGRFITRDVQGFIGNNASLSAFTIPNITLGPNSIIEYGLAGDQTVHGTAAPAYVNVTFSGSGTKTLANANAVSGTISVVDAAIFDSGIHVFGTATTNVTMTGTSRYKVGGVGTKPDAGGTYSLSPGTTVEFYSPSAVNTNPRKSGIVYANVDISGNNIVNTGATGLSFDPAATFTVKSTGIFKLENPDGFTGSTTSAINSSAPPTIVLEPGSVIDYSRAGNQTITPFLPAYSNLRISGSGVKSFQFTPEIKVGEDLLVSNATLWIDPNVTMTVTDAVLNTGGTIEIRDSGSLVQITDVLNATANNNIGNIRMSRTANDMYRYDFTYWSSPVTESSAFSVFELSPDTRFDKYFRWDSLAQDWLIITNGAENMKTGLGYTVRAPETFPMTPALTLPFTGLFEGTPNNGTINVVTHGSSSPLIADAKVNLLGNPYPSAIFADQFIATNTNLGGTLYFWTHNTAVTGTPDVNGEYQYSQADYATYNLSGGTAAAPSAMTGGANTNIPSGKIAAGQGFFVRGITDGASTATFNNSMRIVGENNQFFRNAAGNEFSINPEFERHRIWLNLTNDTAGFSQNLTCYASGATSGLDRLFDGELLGGPIVSLYSIAENVQLTSQGRQLPFDVSDRVTLGYKTIAADNLQITLEFFDGLFDNQNIYIEDKLLNIIHDIKESPYIFTSEAGTFNERFDLRFTTESLSVDDIASGSFAIAVRDKKINLRSSGEPIQSVAVFDLLGRLLHKANSVNSNEHSISHLTLSEQVLIVNTTLSDGTLISRKVIY